MKIFVEVNQYKNPQIFRNIKYKTLSLTVFYPIDNLLIIFS
jgi:hypothetical protein